MTMTCLFFFMEAVLMQGVGRLNLGDTSKLDEPSSLSLFSSTCRDSYLLCKGTWEGGAVTEETCLLHQGLKTNGYVMASHPRKAIQMESHPTESHPVKENIRVNWMYDRFFFHFSSVENFSTKYTLHPILIVFVSM